MPVADGENAMRRFDLFAPDTVFMRARHTYAMLTLMGLDGALAARDAEGVAHF